MWPSRCSFAYRQRSILLCTAFARAPPSVEQKFTKVRQPPRTLTRQSRSARKVRRPEESRETRAEGRRGKGGSRGKKNKTRKRTRESESEEEGRRMSKPRLIVACVRSYKSTTEKERRERERERERNEGAKAVPWRGENATEESA